jgi:hypothetical protein
MSKGLGMPVLGMMDETATLRLRSLVQEIGKRFAEVCGIDMNFGAAGGQQFGLPGGGVRPTGDNGTFPRKRPEDRKLGEWCHADGAERSVHSAAAARHPSMIPLISPRHEPQLVPAFSSLPTASTLWQPRRTAATIWLTPTLKHEQTVAPGSGDRRLDGRRQGEAFAQLGMLGVELRSPSCGQPPPAGGRGTGGEQALAVKEGEAQIAGLRVRIAERFDMVGNGEVSAAPICPTRRVRNERQAPAAIRHPPWPQPNRRIEIARLGGRDGKAIARRLEVAGRRRQRSWKPAGRKLGR